MVEYTEFDIREFIRNGEDDQTEFKRFNTPDDKSTPRKVAIAISSFSNTKGGRIIIGVDDKTHKILGIKENELGKAREKLGEVLNGSIMPGSIMNEIDINPVYLPDEDRYVIVVDVPQNERDLCLANHTAYMRRYRGNNPCSDDRIKEFFRKQIQNEIKWQKESIQESEPMCLSHLAFEMRIRGEIDESVFNQITDVCFEHSELIDALRGSLLSKDILTFHHGKVRFTSPSLYQFYFATWLKMHLDNIDEYLDDDNYREVIITLSSILENPADLCRIIDKLLDSNPILAVRCVANRNKYVDLERGTKIKIRQVLAELLSPINSHICQEIIQLFVQLIHDEDSDIWRRSIRLIRRNKIDQFIGHLIDILQDEENTDLRREEALDALVEMEATSVIDDIGKLLLSERSKNDEFLANLIDGIAKLGDDSASPYLFKILESLYEDVELRRQAASALGSIRNPEIIGRLQSFLIECEDDEVCEAIKEVLSDSASEESRANESGF